jgi:hypothetical protein
MELLEQPLQDTEIRFDDLTPSNFALEIERVVKEKHCNYIDAVCELCDRYELEYTSIPRLLTDTMKEKIEMDALTLNMLKR